MQEWGWAMSHDVFICYSARDKTIATAICAVLEAEGVRCWMAPRDILPGADWGESIIDAINEAKAMVLVFSSNANDAQQQIKREVERAVNKGIAVIPFRIENVMPTKALEYFLSTPHWLDAFTPPLDGHVRQLADSIKRLLGKQTTERPVLTKTPETPSITNLASLAHHHAASGQEGFKIGGVPPAEWIKQPKNAAMAGGAVLVLLLALWFAFRPTAKPEDQQAWNVAAMEDAIPGYQLYMREMPSGYYYSKAESRITELKAEVEDAFAKAKAANTPAAYTNFLNTYAKQGIDLDEARDAYANADARENTVRIAYNSARQMHSRDGYQSFLAQYGASTYAPDVRQRLAACRTETQTTGGTQSSQMSRSATGSGNTAIIACNEARGTVQTELQNACPAGRIANARVLSQNVQNASPAGGRVVGSILGSALFGRNTQNNNIGAVYQCVVEAAASCQKAVSSSHQVDVCP
jgi:hypothetical protein